MTVTLADGRQVTFSSKAFKEATVGTRKAIPDCPYTHLLIYDSGRGGAGMIVALAKLGFAAAAHLKEAPSLSPKRELEEKLRGHVRRVPPPR